MNSGPITPAHIEFGAGTPPFAPAFGDRYHPAVGALAQARHVFLAGNGLPARWAGRDRFVVLETGFGLGNNFLATWQAWRDDPARCVRLVFVSLERHPPRRADLERAHASSALPSCAAALVAAWPPLVPGLQTLDFDGGRVRLLLGFGDAGALLPELRLAADAIYLDGFAPACNPAMWAAPLLKAVGRRATPGATAATWSVARELREGLAAAGFTVERAPGIGGKREITVARFEPRHALRPGAAAGGTGPGAADAIVVGAGIAGACVADALAAEGVAVTVLERAARPAAATSGNAGGLFHGTLHADDGPHARLLRAAALQAARLLKPLIDSGAVPGQAQGLLRLAGRDLAAMQALVDRQHLPADWVQALDAAEASALAGVPLPGPAWFYPGGGWVAPAALAAHRLAQPGVRLQTGAAVHALQAVDGGWRALSADGRPLAEAGAVVLANADDALRLLAPWQYVAPLRRWRGQVSGWQGAPTALRRPVAGDGYALPMADGLLCGATQSADDDEAALREADDAINFGRLQRLTGLSPPAGAPRAWGRVGWRVVAADRQPVAGAVPVPEPAGRRDQAALWPRVAGLYLCTALGGRGLTLAPLLARLLAAQIAGAPWPVERSLAEAVDPARWRVRSERRGAAPQP